MSLNNVITVLTYGVNTQNPMKYIPKPTIRAKQAQINSYDPKTKQENSNNKKQQESAYT
jgi:hypothetical protein